MAPLYPPYFAIQRRVRYLYIYEEHFVFKSKSGHRDGSGSGGEKGVMEDEPFSFSFFLDSFFFLSAQIVVVHKRRGRKRQGWLVYHLVGLHNAV